MNPAAIQALKATVEALLADNPELQDDPAFLLDMVEGETSAFDIIDRLLRDEQEDTAMVDGLTARITEMQARRSRHEVRIAGRRKLIFKLVEILGVSPINRPIATISLRKGAKKVEINAAPEALPDSLVTIIRKPNTTAIKEALEAGQIIPDCRLSNGEPSIAVRFR